MADCFLVFFQRAELITRTVNKCSHSLASFTICIFIGTFKSGSAKCSASSSRKRRAEENLDLEESDSEHSTVAEDQEENDSGAEEVKKGENVEEKVKKTRKKRRFRYEFFDVFTHMQVYNFFRSLHYEIRPYSSLDRCSCYEQKYLLDR